MTIAAVLAEHREYDTRDGHGGCTCPWRPPVTNDDQIIADAWLAHAAEKIAEFVREQIRQEAEGYAGHQSVHALTRFGDKFYTDNKETKELNV